MPFAIENAVKAYLILLRSAQLIRIPEPDYRWSSTLHPLISLTHKTKRVTTFYNSI